MSLFICFNCDITLDDSMLDLYWEDLENGKSYHMCNDEDCDSDEFYCSPECLAHHKCSFIRKEKEIRAMDISPPQLNERDETKMKNIELANRLVDNIINSMCRETDESEQKAGHTMKELDLHHKVLCLGVLAYYNDNRPLKMLYDTAREIEKELG